MNTHVIHIHIYTAFKQVGIYESMFPRYMPPLYHVLVGPGIYPVTKVCDRVMGHISEDTFTRYDNEHAKYLLIY